MTDDRLLERAARSWIETGPTQAPDRAVEAALSRIQTTSQERGLWIPWRLPNMNPVTKLAVAAVIGVVAVAGALMVIRGPSGPGDQATPTPPPPTVIGTWDAEFTRQEMIAAGLADSLEDNAGNYGHFRLTFAGQSFQLVQLTAPNERGSGTFSITGTNITLTFQRGESEAFTMPFTVTDTLLTFGSGGPVTFRVEPWVRVSAP